MEVESGAASDRPVLESALALCRKHKATLLVQKVDRLSRDLELLARLLKDKAVPVKVAQLPNADNFQLHLFGCLAGFKNESSSAPEPKRRCNRRAYGEFSWGTQDWVNSTNQKASGTAVCRSALKSCVVVALQRQDTQRDMQCLERCRYDDP